MNVQLRHLALVAALAAAITPSFAQQAVPAACDGVVPATASFAGTTGAITPPTFPSGTYTAVVSGAGSYLWDLDLFTSITHFVSSSLRITLESPAGTIVSITNRNGVQNNFHGTLWDESANAPVTDYTFTTLVTAPLLSPEGRFAAFRGEDPNGTWKLKITDLSALNTGTLHSWSLDISTLPSAPATSTSTFSRTPALPVGPNSGSITADTIGVSGLATGIQAVTLFLDLPHTFAEDMDITLTSPAGTVVKVTTDNGSFTDNVFAGTLFDPDVTDTVTHHGYNDLAVETPLSPEGPFDAFLGQDPNGTWTLTVVDDAGGDGGTLVRWDLSITTSAPQIPPSTSYAGTPGSIPDFVAATAIPTHYTATVFGVGGYLWDLDLSTFITHTSSGDLDMILRSPAGTIVTITTDNAGTLNHNFNGTSWDDNANDPVTDHAFTNTVATPLSPEGRLTAFRGENPNGTWTLTITDDTAVDDGALNGWSVGVSTLPAAPVTSAATFTRSPGLAILDNTTVSDAMSVSGLGTSLANLTLYVEILHTRPIDLDIALTSPSGTQVIVTTDNAGTAQNAFNGTRFDPDSTDPVTDHVYTTMVVVPVLGPEGSFDNYLGEDPNGVWTLTVADDANTQTGTFVRWDLSVSTCASSTTCVSYCSGDGSGTGCPCGNAGAPGNGCAHSLNGAGANLACSGLASIASDSFVVTGTGMPDSSALYFQGTTRVNGGLGAQFGDGLRCAGGAVVRLGTKANASGTSSYPVAGDPPISVKGVNAAGNVRDYQCWFRNAAAFCTVSTFNLTNAVEATWIP